MKSNLLIRDLGLPFFTLQLWSFTDMDHIFIVLAIEFHPGSVSIKKKKNCSLSPGNREEHPLRQNQWILRTFRWWKLSLLDECLAQAPWVFSASLFHSLCCGSVSASPSLWPTLSVAALLFSLHQIAFTLLCQLPTCSERDVSTKSLLLPTLSFLPLSHSATEEFLPTLLVSVMIQTLPPKGQLSCFSGGRRTDWTARVLGSLASFSRHQLFPAGMIPSLHWLKNCCDFGLQTARREQRKQRPLIPVCRKIPGTHTWGRKENERIRLFTRA